MVFSLFLFFVVLSMYLTGVLGSILREELYMFGKFVEDILKEREAVKMKVKVSDYISVTDEDGKNRIKMIYSFNHLGQDFKVEGKKLYSPHIRKFVKKGHTLYVRLKDEIEVYEDIRDSLFHQLCTLWVCTAL